MSTQVDPRVYVLETREISKSFGAVKAIDQLTMSILREWITCIVGPNGSGKSTLINLLSGMLPLDGGIVVIDNVGLRVVKAHDSPDHGITRTFQEVRLFDQISVLDNIMVVLTERRVFPALLERTQPRHKDEAERILRSVGMWEKRDALAQDLSYGQRKLLEIGRAMAMDVQIYLFDEPFAGLFPRMLEQVKTILKDMRERERSILFVSHNMDIVRELADHLFVLDSGNLLAVGEVDEVLGRSKVIDAYLGH